MRKRIAMSCEMWNELLEHLTTGTTEQAAILFATVAACSKGPTLQAHSRWLLGPADFDHQSAYHIALTDECQARIIQHAWESDLSIVELHSHVGAGATACFSPSDLSGLSEFVPHVWWRLRGRPYAAIVVTSTGFDALIWLVGPQAPEGVSLYIGESMMEPTSLTLRAMEQTYVR